MPKIYSPESFMSYRLWLKAFTWKVSIGLLLAFWLNFDSDMGLLVNFQQSLPFLIIILPITSEQGIAKPAAEREDRRFRP